MSPFALKFSQIILHKETSKLMYNRSFLFEVLHQPTLLPKTFKCFKQAKIDKWPGLHVSYTNFSPYRLMCYRINGKPDGLFIGDIQSDI